uniref:Uncharacterized protein n=1 Tax=viral metagenome TaxID=1070528 RepID=A0A6C0L5W3_9ZZZZ
MHPFLEGQAIPYGSYFIFLILVLCEYTKRVMQKLLSLKKIRSFAFDDANIGDTHVDLRRPKGSNSNFASTCFP